YEDGAPVAVRGRVVLTLFAFDNPPPPAGSATTALNLLSIPGDQLFGDLRAPCAPEGAAPSPSDIVTGSASVTWPELRLGLASAGDIAGAAVTNPQAAIPEIAAIRFGTAQQHPYGQLVDGVSVSLGIPVLTDAPVFFATATPMSSEAPLVLDGTPASTEEAA